MLTKSACMIISTQTHNYQAAYSIDYFKREVGACLHPDHTDHYTTAPGNPYNGHAWVNGLPLCSL